MLGQLLFTITMVTYWLSEGCTEGYTWAKAKRRKENKLIFGSITKGNYVVTDDPFVIKGPWKMMGIEIPRSNVFDWAVAGIGLGLVILSIFI